MNENHQTIPASVLSLESVPSAAKDIMAELESHGFEAYLVGGCVRDLLLGRTPSDWDITTNATPNETENVFRGGSAPDNTVSVGKEHGTIGVIRQGAMYEVTTYRIDGEYSDHRRPDQVQFTRSLEEDLRRRDFTINAMALSLRGELVCVEHAEEDLRAGILRAVGNPIQRFEEDALRIMRGIRFAAQLGFEIEPATAKAIHDQRESLTVIAAERVRVELEKLMLSEDPAPILREYRDIIAVWIPELVDGFDFDQQNPFHCYDVYEHILHAVSATPCDRTVRLAALFHDIGKPECFVVKDGWGHFYKHEIVSASMTKRIMKRLRFDRQTMQDVSELVRAHGAVFNRTEKYARRKLNQLGETQLRRLIQLERADVSAQAFAVRKERVQAIDAFAEIVEKVIAEAQCFSLQDLAVKGGDIIAYGIPAGPEVGRVLRQLLEEVLEGNLSNDKETLLRYVEERKKSE